MDFILYSSVLIIPPIVILLVLSLIIRNLSTEFKSNWKICLMSGIITSTIVTVILLYLLVTVWRCDWACIFAFPHELILSSISGVVALLVTWSFYEIRNSKSENERIKNICYVKLYSGIFFVIAGLFVINLGITSIEIASYSLTFVSVLYVLKSYSNLMNVYEK